MKTISRYVVISLAIALVAMLAVSPATTLRGAVAPPSYPEVVQKALNQTMMENEFGKLLASKNVSIAFGKTGGDKAQCRCADNKTCEITISDNLTVADVCVIKAILAHELTHCNWGAVPITFDEEYDCWRIMARVWRAHKEGCGVTDRVLDKAEKIIFKNGDYKNPDEVRKELERMNYSFPP